MAADVRRLRGPEILVGSPRVPLRCTLGFNSQSPLATKRASDGMTRRRELLRQETHQQNPDNGRDPVLYQERNYRPVKSLVRHRDQKHEKYGDTPESGWLVLDQSTIDDAHYETDKEHSDRNANDAEISD